MIQSSNLITKCQFVAIFFGGNIFKILASVPGNSAAVEVPKKWRQKKVASKTGQSSD
jgi:putative transposon-encoded protein